MKLFKQFLSEAEDKNTKGDDKAYQAFFNKMLKKYDAKSPQDLSKEDKKSFYDDVDSGWKGDNESD
jgi:hypothetical protein